MKPQKSVHTMTTLTLQTFGIHSCELKCDMASLDQLKLMNTEVSSFWVFQGGTFSLIYMKRPYCVILLISDGSVKQKTNSHNQRKKYKKAIPYQNVFFFTFITFVSSFFCPKNVVTEFFLAVLVFSFFRFSFPSFLLAEFDLGSLFSRLMNRLHLM